MTQESEKKPARRVDDKLPGVSVDWSDAPRFNALGIAETWSVTVEAEGQRVLCISDAHVTGLDAGLDQFKETIRSCAMHLLGFIGASSIAATAAPAVSPAPAAAGIEGLWRYRPDYSDAGVMHREHGGEYVKFADVARLLGAHAAVPAKLTDERINELYEEATSYQLVDEDYAGVRLFVRAIEREVLAHAGKAVAAEFSEGDIPADAPRAFAKRYSTLLEENRKLKADLAHAGVTAEPADIKALQEENDQLRTALGDSALAATMLHKLSIENGGINAVYSGGAAQILAEALGQQFTESGAENYLEVGFNTKTGVRLLVTLQRCDGKTPATFRREAEEKLAEAISEIERLRVAAQVPAAEVRAQALEEAAQACETWGNAKVANWSDLGGEMLEDAKARAWDSIQCANAIRSLAQQSAADKASEVRAAEWQPIETAPKDKEIWAFNGEQGRMKWSEGDCWALWVWVDELLADADPAPDQPTHWMHLPNPPSTADSANTGALGEKGAE